MFVWHVTNVEEHDTRGALLVAVHAKALDHGGLLVRVESEVKRLRLLVCRARTVLLMLLCCRSSGRGSSFVCSAHEV